MLGSTIFSLSHDPSLFCPAEIQHTTICHSVHILLRAGPETNVRAVTSWKPI